MKSRTYAISMVCCALRKSRSSSQISSSLDQQKRHFYLVQQDSLSSDWWFRTDHPFYYHPKLGLSAGGGELGGRADQRHLLQQVLTVDSSSAQRQVDREKISQRETTFSWGQFLPIVSGIVGVFFIIYLLYRLRLYVPFWK